MIRNFFKPKRTKINSYFPGLEIQWIGGKRGSFWVGADVLHRGFSSYLFHMSQPAARQLRDFLTEHLSDTFALSPLVRVAEAAAGVRDHRIFLEGDPDAFWMEYAEMIEALQEAGL